MKYEDSAFLEEQINMWLGEEGVMFREFSGFQFRSQQLTLSQTILNAFIDEGFLLAEAGTGIGKTFAYLIPAILWVQHTNNKVVISTRTKALQQQITDQDLPKLLQLMNGKIKYAEAKGRENFLCWNKYMRILAGRKQLSPAEQDFIQSLLRWAEHTASGDRKELDLPGETMRHWPLLAADRNSCARDQCRYQDKCFRLKMIRNVHKADLIIVNHALLLSDMLIDNREASILPDYDCLIVDEAHTFIRESFERLSYRFSHTDVKILLSALYERNRGRGTRGYLQHLPAAYPQLNDIVAEATMFADQAAQRCEELFQHLNGVAGYNHDYGFHHIINESDQSRPAFEQAVDKYFAWKETVNHLLDRLNEINQEITGDDEFPELFGVISALAEISNAATEIMEEGLNRSDSICWLEYERGRAEAICSSPIYTGEMIDELLYRRMRTLVMLSATMTVDNSFDNFINRSGLYWYAQDGRLNTLIEDSPFDYERNAALYIANDMPDPTHPRFLPELQRVLTDILLTSGGRSMVLFTARKQMEDIAEALRPLLLAANLKLLVQNQDGEFASLMEAFKNNENAVLMGVDTYWEGIDLKGDLLKCLVIVKLPFRSPTDPYCSAWDKYYRQQGKNSFEHFLLPDAAIRLKQGVGRLIRSETDRGVVLVLDTRLLYKKYGPVLQNSLPLTNIAPVKINQLVGKIKEWI
ncbi:MAG TPA: ATP-dependent DNA helicase [Syntrophomonas sp.]|nr:ATP-dependent DNA helicase [Syntrophomonas sp.]